MKKAKHLFGILLAIAFVFTTSIAPAQVSWLTKGNAGLSTNHYVGTNDAIPLTLRTNSVTRASVNATGYWIYSTDSLYQSKNKNGATIHAVTNTSNTAASQAQIRIASSTGVLTIAATSETFTPISTHYGIGMTVYQSAATAENVFATTNKLIPHIFCVGGASVTNEAMKITRGGVFVKDTSATSTFIQVLTSASVSAVTPTSQNRTIKVYVGGTAYYLTAKTTND